jgi:hypothetical protein
MRVIILTLITNINRSSNEQCVYLYLYSNVLYMQGLWTILKRVPTEAIITRLQKHGIKVIRIHHNNLDFEIEPEDAFRLNLMSNGALELK